MPTGPPSLGNMELLAGFAGLMLTEGVPKVPPRILLPTYISAYAIFTFPNFPPGASCGSQNDKPNVNPYD